MRATRFLAVAVLGLLIAGCANNQTASTAEARQALAPSGNLRVALLSFAYYASKDPATGELKGPAIDLGRELAGRVGVPFEPLVYPTADAIVASAKSGEWDVAFMGINAERAAAMDFSAPYMEVEFAFVAGPGIPIATVPEVDRPGIRVGVLEKTAMEAYLSKELKQATLVRAKNVADFGVQWQSGAVDVIAVLRSNASDRAARRSGSRVLDGRFFAEPIGMGVPKGRHEAAAAYVGQFAELAKKEGLVKSAIDRAGLRGVVVAPPK